MRQREGMVHGCAQQLGSLSDTTTRQLESGDGNHARIGRGGPSESPKIHEATLACGPSGAVLKGSEIDLTTAVMRRQAGENIVVCGDDIDANRHLAQTIEASVGPYRQERFHRKPGPLALPHFQQADKPPYGHSFYETSQRKARKQP